MNKRLMGISLVAVFVWVGLVPQTVPAATPQTHVSGFITEDGNPVADAEVTVICEGFAETDTTDATGSYLVSFRIDLCPVGSVVRITAKKGPKSGSASGDVEGVTTKLSTAIVNVSIPEYGWIGGLLATGSGVGAIAFTRRRYAQSRSS